MFLRFSFAAVLLLSFGCATTSQKRIIEVYIDSLSTGETFSSPMASVYIENANEGDSFLEKEYFDNIVKSYLKSQNIAISESSRDADFLIRYNYSTVSDSRIESVPIMQMTQAPTTYSPNGLAHYGQTQMNIVGSTSESININHNTINMMCLEKAKLLKQLKTNPKDVSSAAIWQVSLKATTYSNNFKTVFPALLKGFGESIKQPKSETTMQIVELTKN